MSALEDAAAKVQEAADGVAALDLSQEKSDVAAFLVAIAQALQSVAAAINDVQASIGGTTAPEEPTA